MKFDLIDLVTVGASAVFGATTWLSPGGAVGATLCAVSAIGGVVLVRSLLAR